MSGAQRRYHGVSDLARRFGRPPRTIRDWLAQGCPVAGERIALPATLVGKRLLVADEDLERFEWRLRRARRGPGALDLD